MSYAAMPCQNLVLATGEEALDLQNKSHQLLLRLRCRRSLPIVGRTALPTPGLNPLVSDTSGKNRLNLPRGVRVSEPWLSADDIADYLGVTKDTIYAWIADKEMPAHKVGRLWKFQASEVDDWVRGGGAKVGA